MKPKTCQVSERLNVYPQRFPDYSRKGYNPIYYLV